MNPPSTREALPSVLYKALPCSRRITPNSPLHQFRNATKLFIWLPLPPLPTQCLYVVQPCSSLSSSLLHSLPPHSKPARPVHSALLATNAPSAPCVNISRSRMPKSAISARLALWVPPMAPCRSPHVLPVLQARSVPRELSIAYHPRRAHTKNLSGRQPVSRARKAHLTT